MKCVIIEGKELDMSGNIVMQLSRECVCVLHRNMGGRNRSSTVTQKVGIRLEMSIPYIRWRMRLVGIFVQSD